MFPFWLYNNPMSQIIKNIFSFVSPKRRAIFSVLLFVLSGIIYAKPVFAGFWENLYKAVLYVPTTWIAYVLSVFVMASAGLAELSAWIIKWVTSSDFIEWSYTNPATNPVIKIGLDITQPFANMVLVLVLVFIAVATILRLAGYETKKLLPTFIIIALLVNFSPVICGLIVDASNIMMNSLLKNIGGGAQLSAGLNAILKIIDWQKFDYLTSGQETLLGLPLLIIVNCALFLILLLYAFVFAFRYLAIWILVILSPAAFICYILPGTRKFWTAWWNQLVEWSIIGITMSFYLYLADQFAVKNPINVPMAGLVGLVLPYLLPVALLYVGFIAGLATGAAGASVVMGLAKRSGKWVGAKGWKGSKTWLEERTKFREAVGKVVQAVESVRVARWFIPEKARIYAEFRPAIDAAEKELSSFSSRELAYRIKVGELYGLRATAAMKILVSRGDMQDFFNDFKDKYRSAIKDLRAKRPDLKTDEQALFEIPEFESKTARYLQLAQRGGYHNTLLRGDPRLAMAAPLGVKGYEGYSKEEAVARATTEARRQHIINWEREVPEDETIVEYGMTKGREFFEAITVSTKKGQETTLKTIDKLFTAFIDASPPSMKLLAQSAVADDRKKAWDAYNQYFLGKHKGTEYQGLEGYFTAVKTDARFRSLGWREGWYQGTPPPGGSAYGPGPSGGPAPAGGPAPGGGRGRGTKRGRGRGKKPGPAAGMSEPSEEPED